ncbi:MAG: hypothetical protein E7265_05700 [Lachnospiraceae bacterium]|nr:hypothetical protein [Lachnospiraceae bacterium]
MAWCPICKKDFEDEITVCDSCNIELLQGSKDDYSEVLADTDERIVLTAFNELIEDEYDVQYYIDSENTYHLLINNNQYNEVASLLAEKYGDELMSADEDELSPMTAPSEKASIQQIKPYVKPMDKLADLTSSATSLLAVGFLGVIFLICEYLNVFDLHLSDSVHIIFYIVMGVLFTVFIVSGFMSLSSANKLRPVALENDKLIHDVIDYIMTRYNRDFAEESINKLIEDNNIETDDLFFYYQRFVLIKHMITEKFDIDDPSFLEYLTDECYSKIYETDEDLEEAELEVADFEEAEQKSTDSEDESAE